MARAAHLFLPEARRMASIVLDVEYIADSPGTLDLSHFGA